MKKTLALAIVLALVFALCAPAFASDPVVFTLESTYDAAKSILQLTVNVSANSGIQSGVAELTYDANKLSITDKGVKKGELTSDFMNTPNTTEPGKILCALANSSPIDPELGAGSFLIFNFTVKDATGVAEFVFLAKELIAEDTKTHLVGEGQSYTHSYSFSGTEPTPVPSEPPVTGTPAPTNPPVTGSPNPTNPPVTGSPNPTNPPVTGSPMPTTSTVPGSPNPSSPQVGDLSLVSGGIAALVAGLSAAGLGFAAFRKKED